MSSSPEQEKQVYVQRSPKSRALYEEGRKYLPGGVTRGDPWDPYPLYWERGDGYRIWDVDGIERVDFFSNNSALPFGHAYPAVVAALKEQIDKGVSFNAPHEAHIKLAKILCDRIPSVEMVRFTNSGTEATMNCIHAARAYSGRSKIAKVEGAYHGLYDTVGFTGGGDDPRHPDTVSLLPGAPEAMREATVILPFNEPDAAREIILENKDELGAVVVEPMMGGAGFIQAEQEFLSAIREVTSQEGIVLIFDEVCSLRAGFNAGQGLFGVYPDLTAFGKSVGGGAAIGAFGGRRDIMELFGTMPGEQSVGHAGSFNGNPLSMVSGVATFELLTPDVYTRLDSLTERLREGIRAVCAEFDVPVQVTGLGSLFGVHFNESPIRSSRDARQNDKERTQQVMYGLLNEGVWPSRTLIGAVSAVMAEEQIDAYVDALRTVLARNR